MAPSSSTTTVPPSSKQSLGFVANALKRKDSFIQFFAMTGIFLLSMRSVGQKYRIQGLEDDTDALKKENSKLVDRVEFIKNSLFHEAAADKTGRFAARLRVLFGDNN